MREARLAILFSGNGSNLENIYRKMQNLIIDSAKIKLNFALAVSSKESAFGVTRCKNLGLKCEVVDYKKNKENFFPKIMQILRNAQIDLVILAGFMRILPPEFNAHFRAINIHPSILPLFKGANAIKESFESDMKIAGVSVHFVSDELDGGALIAQDIIYKIEGESLESFERRIHELEYEIYPKAIIKAIQIVGNSGNSPLDLHSADFTNLGRIAQTSSLALRPKFVKNHESQTENPSVVDSALAQNLGENSVKSAESTTVCHSERSEESQKKNNRDSSPTAQNDNLRKFAESTLDSANPTTNADSANQPQQTIEGIAVEVVGFLGDFGCETGLKSAKHSKSPKSPQDAPKSKLSAKSHLISKDF